MCGRESSGVELMQEMFMLAALEVKNGASTLDVHSLLVAKGLSPDDAMSVVEKVVQMRCDVGDVGREAMSEFHAGELIYGVAWCGGGLLGLAVCWALKSTLASLVAWAAILYGGYYLVRGVAQAIKSLDNQAR